MITISALLSIVLACIVLGILWLIVKALAGKFGLDPFWLRIIYLIVCLVVVIWAFGLFGISQPLVK
jgi:hypothetical protein